MFYKQSYCWEVIVLLVMIVLCVQAQPKYEIIQRLPSTLLRHDPVTLADGSCCIEPNPSVANCSRCDSRRVDLCFKEIDHRQDDNDITNCPLGRRNRDQPGVGLGEIPILPQNTTTKPYLGGFQLFYTIYQSQIGLTPLIDVGKINITLNVVDRETAGGFTEIEHDAILGLATYSIGLKVVCTENYYGSDCSVLSFCEPQDDDTLGHYTCDSNGNIVCLNGYQNPQSNCTEVYVTTEPPSVSTTTESTGTTQPPATTLPATSPETDQPTTNPPETTTKATTSSVTTHLATTSSETDQPTTNHPETTTKATTSLVTTHLATTSSETDQPTTNHPETTTKATTSLVTTHLATTSSETPETTNSNTTSTPAAQVKNAIPISAGVVVGLLVILIVAIVLIVVLVYKRRKLNKEGGSTVIHQAENGATSVDVDNYIPMYSTVQKDKKLQENPPPIVPCQENIYTEIAEKTELPV